MFISKDTESLPNGFTQRCELLKGSSYSQCPSVSLGSSPALDDVTWELQTPRRTWNLIMETSSEHRATCSPFSQAETRSLLGHTAMRTPSSSEDQPCILLLSKAHVPDVPPGKARLELPEHSSRGCQRQTRCLFPSLGFCFSSCWTTDYGMWGSCTRTEHWQHGFSVVNRGEWMPKQFGWAAPVSQLNWAKGKIKSRNGKTSHFQHTWSIVLRQCPGKMENRDIRNCRNLSSKGGEDSSSREPG